MDLLDMWLFGKIHGIGISDGDFSDVKNSLENFISSWLNFAEKFNF